MAARIFDHEPLREFDISILHFVFDYKSIRFYGLQNLSSVSCLKGKRVLVEEHKIIKVKETTYKLSSSNQVILTLIYQRGFWKFGFDVDFYKQYQQKSYQFALSFLEQ